MVVGGALAGMLLIPKKNSYQEHDRVPGIDQVGSGGPKAGGLTLGTVSHLLLVIDSTDSLLNCNLSTGAAYQSNRRSSPETLCREPLSFFTITFDKFTLAQLGYSHTQPESTHARLYVSNNVCDSLYLSIDGLY